MGSPVSPIAANIFMEALEQKAIITAPLECKPKLWLRYVDDILEIVNKDCIDQLTEHINKVDPSGSIKFTYEKEEDGKLPFLDTIIVRKEDGSVKLLVYRKPTHTDQYLNFDSHHPLHQKLGVIRTLYDRKDNIITEAADKEEEEKTIQEALRKCGYPPWTFKKVKHQMATKQKKKTNTKKKDDTTKSNGFVVLPYVKGVTERVSRVMKNYNLSTAMKPHCTIRRQLVHPKDKREPRDVTHAVYSIPCKNCDKVYVGETARLVGTRIDEHKKEADALSKKIATRATRKTSLDTEWKSATTDHVADTNHVIDWGEVKIVGNETNKYTRWVKEAIQIRKTGADNLNRDEGQYFLTHIFDDLLTDKKQTGNSKASVRGNSH